MSRLDRDDIERQIIERENELWVSQKARESIEHRLEEAVRRATESFVVAMQDEFPELEGVPGHGAEVQLHLLVMARRWVESSTVRETRSVELIKSEIEKLEHDFDLTLEVRRPGVHRDASPFSRRVSRFVYGDGEDRR